ncbi:MAG: hypothetical protein WC052_04680 [Patescibacteria group bacterium]|jgi:hypothetical protein
MSNGSNEPIEFTRGDAERLIVIETKQTATNEKLDDLATGISTFMNDYSLHHVALEKAVAANTRFRKTTIRILLWVISTSGGLGLLAAVAEAAGWLH